MQHNLAGRFARQEEMEREVKAIVQQYMMRMTEDRLLPDKVEASTENSKK
jgi:hypothetical protein